MMPLAVVLGDMALSEVDGVGGVGGCAKQHRRIHPPP